jgi:hypothetical protein
MRKVLMALALATVVVFASTGGASADNRGADWLVAGTGTLVCCGQPMVHVNAQSNAGGLNARGHFWIRYPNGGAEFGGTVVCLSVAANSAGLIGHIERVKVPGSASSGFVFGNYLRVRITDVGSPGTADLVNFDPGTSINPGTCSGVGDLVISQGNYVVHDRPVLDLLGLDQLIAQFEAAANDPY